MIDMPVRKLSKKNESPEENSDESEEYYAEELYNKAQDDMQKPLEPVLNTEAQKVCQDLEDRPSISETTIFVPMDEQKIREMAFQNAQKKMSFNELVWYISENDVRLKNAIPMDQNPLIGKKTPEVIINLNKVIKAPSQDDVKKVAQTLASFRPNIPELNWNLAVRQYIFDSIKNKL